MLKYRLERIQVEVWVDTDRPHESVTIQYRSLRGIDAYARQIQRIVSRQYGLFGHSIIDEASPFDLKMIMENCADLRELSPVLIEGANLVSGGYKDGFPRNSRTLD